jgi:hypothetical protein
MTWRFCLLAALVSGCGTSSHTADSDDSERESAGTTGTADLGATAQRIFRRIRTCDENESIFTEVSWVERRNGSLKACRKAATNASSCANRTRLPRS